VDTDGDGVFETTLVEGADFDLYPLNDGQKAMIRLRPGGALTIFPDAGKVVEVNASWGWAQVPAAIQQATLLTASRWFKRKDVEYVASSEAGNPRVLDPDVMALIEPFKLKSSKKVLGAVP
jgi:hypothetical protein